MIHLILGRQGSGKTIYMVKTSYDHINRNSRAIIYSNFHLNFKYSEINYKDIIECRLTNCITLLDEIHLILPARLSLRRINQEICDNFLSMARKQNNDIYGTTQTDRKVDVRFREEADYVHFCTKYAYINNTWVEVLHDKMITRNTLCMIQVDVVDTMTGNMVRSAFIANHYYKLYDTYQVVRIKGLKEAMDNRRKKSGRGG